MQAPEFGVVRAIHVTEGQKVRACDTLVDLDPTISGADRDRLAREALVAALDVARLEALLAGPDNSEAKFKPPATAPVEMLGMQRQLLTAESAKFCASLAALDEKERRRQATRDVSMAQLDKLGTVMPLLRDTEQIVRALAADGHARKLRYNDVKERLISAEKDQATEAQRLREAEAGIVAARAQRRHTDEGKALFLRSGLGNRTVLSYVLDPIVRHAGETLRER